MHGRKEIPKMSAKIQKFSFDFRDQYFDFDGLQFAFRVCTMENVYGPDPEKTRITSQEMGIRVEAKWLQFAGGQRKCPGHLIANLWKDGGELMLKVEAEHQEIIKGITILIRGLAAPVDEERIESWPRHVLVGSEPPFGQIKTVEGGTAAMMPTTTKFRFRRWAVYHEYSGYWVFNMSEDEECTKRCQKMDGSEWVIVRNPILGAMNNRWYKLIERERGLKPWKERADVPTWLRQVSLVLNMHCEGWTGYVFNTFNRQLEILRWIAERIEGKHVLVYLAGWDGRYYWNYPVYEPSKACGGAEGFKRLMDGAHQLGIHVIPMFSLIASNYKKTKKLGFQQATCRTVYDYEEICDWTEWDEDLSTDPIWQSLNVGEARFREYLLNRIYWVTDTFDTDGVVLDISGWMPRDPQHNLLEGLKILIENLHARYREFLIFGEYGCELHMPLIPIFHSMAHLEADHPFYRYCRTAYHLSIGAPGRGSTGVHEQGVNPYQRPCADKPAIPTLGIVGDTLSQHANEIEAVIRVAKDWAKRWNT